MTPLVLPNVIGVGEEKRKIKMNILAYKRRAEATDFCSGGVGVCKEE